MDQNCTIADGKDSVFSEYEMIEKESVRCDLLRTK